MASVVVNGDTSGAVTLSAPAVAGTVTVTLPSTSGTMAVTGASQSFTNITATGTIQGASTIGVGNATPAASGAGITFPATQSASSDVNTLDDYEEGTWTPSLGGTATYSARTGDYVKIGVMVTAFFDITVSSIGTGSGSLISGLPFTSGGGTQGMPGSASFWSSLATALTFLNLRVDLGATTIGTSGTSAAQTTITNGPNIFGNGARLVGSVTYRTA